jgi:CheY-like chemotaxis protein
VIHVDIRAVPIDLNKHIIGMKKMFQVSIPRQIGLKILLAENLSWINADPSQLDQILMNLVSNAGDAIEDSGQITIETFNFLVNEEFASSHLKARPGEYVVLKVSDTGSGMEKSVQNRIFEPFFTTREPGKGTGLGLSVIFGAVHELGGFMDFNSEPGLGTTFRVYFPAINTDQIITATEQSEIIKNEIRGVSETVLLVDDDPELIEIGEVVLKDAGYRVLTANDGEEAIDIYRRNSEHISLVILDLIMPTMSGIQCLMELKKIDDSVKVLVASGYSPDNQVAEAMSAGASGFLGKPYIFSRLLQTVREIIERQ